MLIFYIIFNLIFIIGLIMIESSCKTFDNYDIVKKWKIRYNYKIYKNILLCSIPVSISIDIFGIYQHDLILFDYISGAMIAAQIIFIMIIMNNFDILIKELRHLIMEEMD